MSYIDIGIIVVVALCALIGLKRGFFKSLVSLLGWLVTFAAAFFLTKTIAYALLDVKAVSGFVAGTDGGFSLYSWVSSWEWIKSMDAAPSFILTMFGPLMESVTAASAEGMFTVSEGLALYIAYYMYCIIVFIGLFIIIKIVVSIVLAFIKTLGNKGEKPGGFSRLLGFVVSAVKGGVYVVLLLLIFSYAAAVPQLNSVGAKVEESMIGGPVYAQVKSISGKYLSTSDEDTIKKLIGIAGITGVEPTEETETPETETPETETPETETETPETETPETEIPETETPEGGEESVDNGSEE